MLTGLIASIGIKTILGATGLGGFGFVGTLLGWPKKIGSLIGRIPKNWWPWITGLIAAVAFFVVHQHIVHKRIEAAFNAGYAQRVDEDKKAAAKITATVTAVTQPIATKLRSENDATVRDIHAAADAQRVRGPGAAACTSDAPAAGSASGHEPPSGGADAPVAKLPYPSWQQLLGVPFDDTTRFAEQADINRAEVLTWRKWYSQEWQAWEKLRSGADHKGGLGQPAP